MCKLIKLIKLNAINRYREKKIRLLKCISYDFMIYLTPEDINNFNSLETKCDIDHYCRELLWKKIKQTND